MKIYDYYTVNGVNGRQNDPYVESDIILYNGVQQHVPYDDTSVSLGNLQWVINQPTGATSSGTWLHDVNEYNLDNEDYGFISFLSQKSWRPTRVRYTVYYWYAGGTLPNMVASGGGSPLDVPTLPNSGQKYNMDGGGVVLPPGSPAGVYSTVAYETINYTSDYSYAYVVPVGPKTLLKNGMITAPAAPSTWMYVNVDLLSATNAKLNRTTFRVNRKEKCNKYGRWQLFWLNKHGAFDNFTFEKKNTLEVKVAKTTYKQRLLPDMNPEYSAGERVFYSNITEEFTLRSYIVTQKESQLIISLVESPVCYAVREYVFNGNTFTYAEPYIVTSDSVVYQSKANDKEVTYEISVRAANEVQVQAD